MATEASANTTTVWKLKKQRPASRQEPAPSGVEGMGHPRLRQTGTYFENQSAENGRDSARASMFSSDILPFRHRIQIPVAEQTQTNTLKEQPPNPGKH